MATKTMLPASGLPPRPDSMLPPLLRPTKRAEVPALSIAAADQVAVKAVASKLSPRLSPREFFPHSANSSQISRRRKLSMESVNSQKSDAPTASRPRPPPARAASAACGVCSSARRPTPPLTRAASATEGAPQSARPSTSSAIPVPKTLTCKAWALLDSHTGRLVKGGAHHEVRGMASLTKMMTALIVSRLARHSPEVLEDIIYVSPQAGSINGTSARLRPGDRFSVLEALYGMMLPSGNDAALALAEHFGGRIALRDASDRSAASTPPLTPLSCLSTRKESTGYVWNGSNCMPEHSSHSEIVSPQAATTTRQSHALLKTPGSSARKRKLRKSKKKKSKISAGKRLQRELANGGASSGLAEVTIEWQDEPSCNLDECTPKERSCLFVELMNEVADTMQMHSTTFVNPHGLGNPRHVSTAADMGTLAFITMKEPLLRKVVATQQFSTRVFNESSCRYRSLKWINTNKLLSIPGWDGVKTGVTPHAGGCLASRVTRSAKSFIVIVLGCSSTNTRFSDSQSLARWAFRAL